MAYEADPYQTPIGRLNQYKDLFDFTRGLPATPPQFPGAPPGTQMFMPGPPPPRQHFFGRTPGDLALNDTPIGKPSGPVQYGIGPQSGGHVTEPLPLIDALKANKNLRDILNTNTYIHGRQGLFGVSPEHLQQLAGDVLYPGPNRFMPIDPTDPTTMYTAAQRYEQSQMPGGLRAIQGPTPPNIQPITPTTTKWGR